MRFGLQIPNFTTDETPGALFDGVVAMATAAEETGYDSVWVMDHFYQLPSDGRAEPADARCLHAARRPGDADVAGAARHHGDGRHLPQPGPPGQDRDDARRHQRGTGHPRHRGGVVRRGARGPGLRLPPGRRAARPPGGGAADLPGHVHRGGPDVRRPLLPDPRGPQRAAAGAAGRAAHPHRRRRREADPQAGGALRRHDATSSATPPPWPTRSRSCAATARPSGATRPR